MADNTNEENQEEEDKKYSEALKEYSKSLELIVNKSQDDFENNLVL